jgi:hypothetical protein
LAMLSREPKNAMEMAISKTFSTKPKQQNQSTKMYLYDVLFVALMLMVEDGHNDRP